MYSCVQQCTAWLSTLRQRPSLQPWLLAVGTAPVRHAAQPPCMPHTVSPSSQLASHTLLAMLIAPPWDGMGSPHHHHLSRPGRCHSTAQEAGAVASWQPCSSPPSTRHATAAEDDLCSRHVCCLHAPATPPGALRCCPVCQALVELTSMLCVNNENKSNSGHTDKLPTWTCAGHITTHVTAYTSWPYLHHHPAPLCTMLYPTHMY